MLNPPKFSRLGDQANGVGVVGNRDASDGRALVERVDKVLNKANVGSRVQAAGNVATGQAGVEVLASLGRTHGDFEDGFGLFHAEPPEW